MPAKKKPNVQVDVVQHAPLLPVVTEKRKIITTKVMPALHEKYGTKALMWAEDVPEMPMVSTGIHRLDTILEGGIEVGGIVTIHGLDGSGKTSLAWQIASQEQGGVLYIDGERKLSSKALKSAMRRFGVHGLLAISQPEPSTLEGAFDIALKALRAGIKLVILDSLPSFASVKQMEQKDFTKKAGVSSTALFLSEKLGMIADVCSEMQSTLLVINQLRDTMNMTNPFGERLHAFGGHQLKGLSKLVIRCARMKDIKVVQKGEKVTIGIVAAWQVRKCSYAPSNGAGGLPLLYDKGFIQDTDMPEAAVLEDDPSFVSVEEEASD